MKFTRYQIALIKEIARLGFNKAGSKQANRLAKLLATSYLGTSKEQA